MKYPRDLDSNWTVNNDKPVFGMKEHASIDVESGLDLSTYMSKASEHDYNYFEYIVAMGIHGKDVPSKVYADKGYCGKSNPDFLHFKKIGDGIMHKDQVNATLTTHEIQRNTRSQRSDTRSSSTSASTKISESRKSPIHQPIERIVGSSPRCYGLQYQTGDSAIEKATNRGSDIRSNASSEI